MAQQTLDVAGAADQRYYHFVAVRASTSDGVDGYWRALRNARPPRTPLEFSGAGFSIQHRQLRSPKLYARGAVAQAVSQSGDGSPPYLYDVFAARVDIRRSSYLLFGFPFAALALDVARDVFGTGARSPFGDFSSIDIPRLIRVMEAGGESRSDHVSMSVVAVQVSVRDDRSLTAVRLGGDDPLSAELYRKYLKPKISLGELVPDHCVLSCERDNAGDPTAGRRILRSRVHVDHYGNLKFYAHVGCGNLSLIASVLTQLDAMQCLVKAENNPLFRLGSEEDTVLGE